MLFFLLFWIGCFTEIYCFAWIQSCSVQTNHDISHPVLCTETDENHNKSWFLYTDDVTNETKIGLNITLSPSASTSVYATDGYQHIFSVYIADDQYNECEWTKDPSYFLTPSYYLFMEFPFMADGKTFYIYAQSDESLKQSTILVPSCIDPRMSCVNECIIRRLYGSVSVDCENRSVTLTYRVPEQFWSTAEYALKKENQPSVPFIKGNSTNGSITMPFPKNLTGLYYFEFQGYNEKKQEGSARIRLNVSFEDCNIGFQDLAVSLPLIAVILPTILIALCLVIGFLKFKVSCKNLTVALFPKFTKKHTGSNGLPFETIETSTASVNSSHTPRKVYILFVDDHPMHRDIVLKFTSLLHFDLHFDILYELYCSKKVYANPLLWMQKSFADADKIIVIWSPGAKKRLEDYNSGSSPQCDDVFTPVLKNIQNELFRGCNIERYVFVYFEYCTKADIPKIFSRSSRHHYKIPDQLDEMLSQLGDASTVNSKILSCCSGSQKSDVLYTKYGFILTNAIKKMCKYVQDDPKWYSHGGSNHSLSVSKDSVSTDFSDHAVENDIHKEIDQSAISDSGFEFSHGSDSNVYHDVITKKQAMKMSAEVCDGEEEIAEDMEQNSCLLYKGSEKSFNLPCDSFATCEISAESGMHSSTLPDDYDNNAPTDKKIVKFQLDETKQINELKQHTHKQGLLLHVPCTFSSDHALPVRLTHGLHTCSDGECFSISSINDFESLQKIEEDPQQQKEGMLSHPPVLDLVPLDRDCDPMNSLVSINLKKLP